MSHLHPVPKRQAGVDPETGEIDDGMPRTLPEAWDMIQTLERKFRAACGQITRLTNELHDKRKKETEAAEIEQVLTYWRDNCMPRAQVVAGDPRWEKVRARMHDKIKGRPPWQVWELKLAVDGALVCPWLNGSHEKTGGKKYLDATTIFRDAKQVQRLMELGEQHQEAEWERKMNDFHARHPSAVWDAIQAEKHSEALRDLDPESWDMWAARGSRDRENAP